MIEMMNLELLDNKLQKISSTRPEWAIPIFKLKDWLKETDPIKKHRINPYVVSSEISSPLRTIVGIFLHGVKEGAFRLHWDTHCPHCDMITEEKSYLQETKGDSYCRMCDGNFTVDFSKRVEVTFSLHPEIEIIHLPPFCTPPAKAQVFAGLRLSNQGDSAETEVELVVGKYRYFCPISSSRGILTIEGELSSELQEMRINQLEESRYDHPYYRLKPGKIKIIATNKTELPCGFFLTYKDLKEELGPEDFGMRLSGLEIIHFPEFKEIFGKEKLSDREKMTIESITILFTDITGSTKMYEELGDIKAYNIVRDHFDILIDAIQKRGGTIVKTIGDAIMASFLRPTDCLETIFMIREKFLDYNEPRRVEEKINLKIGVHTGPAILVNLNERIDYFGTTINKAARIQNFSTSNWICISEEVFSGFGVKEVLKKNRIHRVNRKFREMKGLSGKHPIYFVPFLENTEKT